MKKLHPVLRGVLSAVLVLAVSLIVGFIRAKVKGIEFEPHWFEDGLFAVICGVLAVFAPDAEQRKKNREKLLGKFKK